MFIHGTVDRPSTVFCVLCIMYIEGTHGYAQMFGQQRWGIFSAAVKNYTHIVPHNVDGVDSVVHLVRDSCAFVRTEFNASIYWKMQREKLVKHFSPFVCIVQCATLLILKFKQVPHHSTRRIVPRSIVDARKKHLCENWLRLSFFVVAVVVVVVHFNNSIISCVACEITYRSEKRKWHKNHAAGDGWRLRVNYENCRCKKRQHLRLLNSS